MQLCFSSSKWNDSHFLRGHSSVNLSSCLETFFHCNTWIKVTEVNIKHLKQFIRENSNWMVIWWKWYNLLVSTGWKHTDGDWDVEAEGQVHPQKQVNKTIEYRHHKKIWMVIGEEGYIIRVFKRSQLSSTTHDASLLDSSVHIDEAIRSMEWLTRQICLYVECFFFYTRINTYICRWICSLYTLSNQWFNHCRNAMQMQQPL